jgi:hypothetical protein
VTHRTVSKDINKLPCGELMLVTPGTWEAIALGYEDSLGKKNVSRSQPINRK